jgi:predicted RNA-binding protein (virulence factor B family)
LRANDLLGRFATLPIQRLALAGAVMGVDGDPDAMIVLPTAELPAGAQAGTKVRVFVYLDTEDRLVATTREPRLTLGQATFLTVTACTNIGAFVDWGLGKELLVPFAEQARELFVGERVPIQLYLDKSARPAGTMYVKLLDRRRVDVDEWIEGEAWRNEPGVGLFAILEKGFVGMMPASEPHQLARGEVAKFRVTTVLPDGKLVLSLRQRGYKEMAGDAARILEVLRRPGAPRVGDHSPPEALRDVFGLSKKAFKRAVGRLLKERAVTLDAGGCVVPAPDPASPRAKP